MEKTVAAALVAVELLLFLKEAENLLISVIVGDAKVDEGVGVDGKGDQFDEGVGEADVPIVSVSVI